MPFYSFWRPRAHGEPAAEAAPEGGATKPAYAGYALRRVLVKKETIIRPRVVLRPFRAESITTGRHSAMIGKSLYSENESAALIPICAAFARLSAAITSLTPWLYWYAPRASVASLAS
jgi:hypothetical protein